MARALVNFCVGRAVLWREHTEAVQYSSDAMCDRNPLETDGNTGKIINGLGWADDQQLQQV